MSGTMLRPSLAEQLQAAAAAYQEAHVIPHCSVCEQPCCRLDKLVLEMDWKQVKTLWKIEDARAAFDRKLAAGQGPVEIREGNGLYYIHTRPCPAYDEAGHSCRVYGQDVKPPGCSDFPVYEDGGCVMADLRCEAVDLDALLAWLTERLGPEFRIVESADRDFPILITLAIRRQGAKPGSGKRRSR